MRISCPRLTNQLRRANISADQNKTSHMTCWHGKKDSLSTRMKIFSDFSNILPHEALFCAQSLGTSGSFFDIRDKDAIIDRDQHGDVVAGFG